jgi:hypothetical protein
LGGYVDFDDAAWGLLVVAVKLGIAAIAMIQTVPILDTVGDHYRLLDIGWDDSGKRVFQPTIHVDLMRSKVWIQENMTDLDIAKVFVTSGISAGDIVLGLHSPALRQYSDYAVE